MKKTLTTAIAAIISLPLFSQTHNGFFYDEAGNRTERRMVMDDGWRTRSNSISFSEYSLELNTDYSVGAIPIQGSVMPSGAKTYSLTIPTASDYSLTPSVSIVYSSQSGDGDIAWGWNIAGISRITLSNKTQYYDGDACAAVASGDDRVFALDGERLVQGTTLPGTYELQTARSHILVHHSRARDPQTLEEYDRFSVAYPDGRKAVFRQLDPSSPATSFPIVEMLDEDGNSIRYTYIRSGGNDYISSITYGNDVDGIRHATIEFNWGDNDNPTTKYLAGIAHSNDKRLVSVSIYDGDTELLTYSFSMGSVDEELRLVQLNCTSEGEALPPVSFGYRAQGSDDFLFNGTSWTTVGFSHPDSCSVASGRFFNDSFLSGVVAFEPGSDQILIQPIAKEGSNSFTISAGSGFQTVRPADIDGDGRDEVVRLRFAGTTSGTSSLETTVYSISGMSDDWTFDFVTHTVQIPHPSLFSYQFGSFLGNGKDQLMVVSCCGVPTSPNVSYITLVDLQTGTVLLHEPSPFQLPLSDFGELVAMDIDSDGRTELIRKNATMLEVYRCNAQTLSLTLHQTLSELPALPSLSDALFADINADGYVDFIFKPTTAFSTFWNIYLYTGTDLVRTRQSITRAPADDRFLFMDADRDGLPDLIHKSASSVSWHLNRRGIIQSTACGTLDLSTADCALIPSAVYGNSGMAQLMVLEPHYISGYRYNRSRNIDRLVYSATDSYGVTTQTTYDDIARGGTTAYQTSTPQWNVQRGFHGDIFPLNVVTNETAQTGGNTIADQTYHYSDLCTNSLGLGFCGFRQITVQDAYGSGVEAFRTVTTYDPQKSGVPVQVMTYSLGTGEAQQVVAVSSAVNTYDDHATQYGKDDPRLISSAQTDLLTGRGQRTEYVWSTLGLPTRVVGSTAINGIAGQRDTTTYTYSNVISSSRYHIGLPTSVSTSTKKGDAAVWKTRTQTTYNAKGHPMTVVESVGEGAATNVVRRQEFTYTSLGRVASASEAQMGTTAFNTTAYTYDATGRYLTSSTDPLGRTTHYGPRDKWGNVLQQTDFRGNVSTSQTDVWGNVISTTAADGSTTTTTMQWGGTGLYTVTTTSNAAPSTVSHIDALGREVLRTHTRFNGSSLKVRTTYDAKGRKHTESLPYKGTMPLHVTTYTYDRYGRAASIVTPTGATTTWTYDGTSVTRTENGISITTTTDSAGDVVSTSDAGGTVERTLRSDGQPSAIGSTLIAYDGYGRRLSVTDQSSGQTSWSYSYPGDGSHSVTCTTPLGSKTQSYDRYGRIISVDTPSELCTTYTYNADGDLLSETSTNGTSRSFTYDALGRVAATTEYADADNWLQTAYAYNSLNGTLAATTFTSNYGALGTESYTYANGCLVSTHWNGESVMQLISEDALGLPSQVLTGQINRYYTHDQFGQETARRARTIGASADLQSHSYTYDITTGNLTTRTDVTRGLTESFSYDALDRLSAATKSAGTEQMRYSQNGNLTFRSSVGEFTYGDPDHPYQMTGAPATAAISSQTQSIDYSLAGRPISIEEGNTRAEFTYNASGDRVRMEIRDGSGNLQQTRLYLGDRYEVDLFPDGNRVQTLWLAGSPYDAPAMWINETYSGSDQVFNILRDRQGSITHSVRSDGFYEERSYDAWGRLRNPDTWAPLTPNQLKNISLTTLRAYTSHELLPWFALYNCNARLYDPTVARFLGPDPFVQIPDFSQSFNRYSYCLNNPLKYTDESGEYLGWDDLIAMGLGGFGNWLSNGAQFTWAGLAYFLLGAITAEAALYGASPLVMSFLTGAGNSVIAQGFGSTGNTWNSKNISIDAVLLSSAISLGTFYIGGSISGVLGSGLDKAFDKIIPTTWGCSDLLANTLKTSLTSGASGFTIGAGISFLNNRDLSVALRDGIHSGISGLSIGAAMGFSSSVFKGITTGRNPFTGKRYPDNDGFIEKNDSYLTEGMVVDRYGDESGSFLSTPEYSISQRGLPRTTSASSYNQYEVIKSFPVNSGHASPVWWFGARGGGVQYKTSNPINYYIENGFLKKL